MLGSKAINFLKGQKNYLSSKFEEKKKNGEEQGKASSKVTSRTNQTVKDSISHPEQSQKIKIQDAEVALKDLNPIIETDFKN